MPVAFSSSPVFRVPVSAPPPVGDHAYFESLLTNPNFWKAVSLRPRAGETSPSSPYWEDQLVEEDHGGLQSDVTDGLMPLAFSYDPGGDTDPHAQDACKLSMSPVTRTTDATLTSGCDGVETVLQCTSTATASKFNSSFSVNKHVRLDDEFCKITARDGTLKTITVLRAQGGTSAVPHAAGTIPYVVTNSTTSLLEIDLDDTGEVTRFFFTWDAYYTDSFMHTGLVNHKAFQIETGGSAIWFEPNNTYSPGVSAGDFDPDVHTAAFQVRSYSHQLSLPATEDEPLEPIENTFSIFPFKWVRYFVLLKVRSLTDAASYADCGADLAGALTAEVSDATLAVGVNTTATLLQCSSAADAATFEASFPVGGYARVDYETCLITAVDGTAKTITVTRHALGSDAKAHSAGAAVYAVSTFTVDTTSMHAAAFVSQFENRDYIKVGSEILRLLEDGSGSNPRTLTVARGQLGTTPAAHAAGAAVSVCTHVLATVWIADEDREAVRHFADLPVAMHGEDSAGADHTLSDFLYEWNTSNDGLVDRSTRPLVSYHRNWAALKSPTLDPVADGLLVKPGSV